MNQDSIPPFADEQTAITLPPFIEVEFSYEQTTPQQASQAPTSWRALEVWTRNRIYAVDWSMKCVAVVDRESGREDASHPMLGCYLTGGQRIDENGAHELTYPCPRPGTDAVFENRARRGVFSQTSTVERVVLRLRVQTVRPERVEPMWEELSGSFNMGKLTGKK